MTYRDCLRRLTLNDAAFVEKCTSGHLDTPSALSIRELAVTRLAALIAIGGPEASYGAIVDAALDAGLTADEIVDVLLRVMPTSGIPRAVGEAPKLAAALGYDIDAALEASTPP